MVDIAVSIASKVAEYLVAPVGRHCGYVIFSDSYVVQLREELKKVEDVRQRVQHSVDEAQNNMKLIEADVTEWVKEVETVVNKALSVLDYEGRAKKTCFHGWLPNPKARYRLGRDVEKTVNDIRALIARGQFQNVYYEGPPKGLVTGTPGEGGTITDSRASIFEGIMKALDDEKLKVIGVYGAGGVGKTTLLKEVEEKLKKEGRPFHMIAKSTVSNIADLKNIQHDIAYAFGLNLKSEPSEVGRRDLLSKRLKDDPTKNVLIILDDLWDKLDLEAVGIPSGDESTKCKLLLASRDRSVLQQKMSANATFRLGGLSTEEAFRLFEKTYGPDKLKDEGYEAKAAQVVAKLAGLPLLIKSVASTLKYGVESTWDTALTKIKDPNIKAIVDWSYGRLDSEETKSLFLLCGFIGGSIPVELLLGLGMGLGLFRGFDKTIRSSRNKLNDMLHSLRSICLLQDDGDDEKIVTIHDLYSEEVISTPLTCQNSLIIHHNTGSWPKEKLEKCWVCLVNVGSKRLAELKLNWFPDLKIFMLLEQHDEGDCDGPDFTSMKELRVLYPSSINFTSSPSSIQVLKNLWSLYLDNCDVEDVAIFGELKSLQILSFAGSKISRLPKAIGKLMNLKLLNLSHCQMLRIIEPGVLGGLINLEELYMRESFDKWMGKDEISSESCNAKLAELKSLRKLTTLEISIPNPNVLLEDGDLPFKNLIGFWIKIGNAHKGEFEDELEGLRTMKLNLEGCDGILSKEFVQKTLHKTQYLLLEGLREFNEKSAHELCSQGFPELKHLDIRNCSSIKHIVISSDGAFPILESLRLENLTNLEKICSGPKYFGKLKVISVTKCDQLEYLWSLSQMHRLAQLEGIQVVGCDSIRAIVIDYERKEIIADNRVKLPNVRYLELTKLPKMTSFCIAARITSDGAPIQVGFPRLESLDMEGLIDLEKILYGQPSLEYNSLKSIEIRESKSTSSILKSDWILKLPNLESLKIRDSPSAEAVFDVKELKVTGHVEILSRLTELELSDLPNLRRMWKENAQLQGISVFRNLKELKVTDTGLAFLFPVSVAKCLREIRVIEVCRCENMEAVFVDEDGREEGPNDIIEFPLLKRLYIGYCPKIKFFLYLRGKKEAMAATSDSQDAYSDSFFDQKVHLPSLARLRLDGAGSIKRIWPRELPKNSFDNLADLYLYDCSELLNIFPSTITGRLHNLRMGPSIIDCPSLESVFECGSLDSKTTEQAGVLLPKLGGEPVSEARRLSHVVKSDSQTVLALPNLKDVHVRYCCKLRYLFPYVMATTLEKLESLEISYCEQMKEVVAKDEGDRAKADVMSFPSLKRLHIQGCENFEAFIWNSTFVERQLGSQTILALPNLEEVIVFACSKLRYLFPYVMATTLEKLESLYISHCDQMKEVVTQEEGDQAKADVMSFPSLKRLSIHVCHNFEAFIRNSTIVERQLGSQTILALPNLEEVDVFACSKLRYLFPYVMATTLEKLESLYISYCDQMKEVVAKEDGDRAKADVMSFPSLKNLHISWCDNLEAFIRNSTIVERQLGVTVEENDESSQPLFNEMVTLPNLRRLNIDRVQCKELWNSQVPINSFCKLEDLVLENCNNLQRIAPSHIWKKLQHCLKILHVRSCRSIKIIYESDGPDTKFAQLRTLNLSRLENLRHIWLCGGLSNIPFSNLRDIEVLSCPSLEILFPTFTAEFLGQIEKLVMRDCENVELIADHGECGEATSTTITFSKLTTLRLVDLPKFRRYLPEKYSLEFPPEASLYVHSCGTEPDQSTEASIPLGG